MTEPLDPAAGPAALPEGTPVADPSTTPGTPPVVEPGAEPSSEGTPAADTLFLGKFKTEEEALTHITSLEERYGNAERKISELGPQAQEGLRLKQLIDNKPPEETGMSDVETAQFLEQLAADPRKAIASVLPAILDAPGMRERISAPVEELRQQQQFDREIQAAVKAMPELDTDETMAKQFAELVAVERLSPKRALQYLSQEKELNSFRTKQAEVDKAAADLKAREEGLNLGAVSPGVGTGPAATELQGGGDLYDDAVKAADAEIANG